MKERSERMKRGACTCGGTMREVLKEGGQRPRWGHAHPVEGARMPRKEGAYA
jgi:hypothetical protein